MSNVILNVLREVVDPSRVCTDRDTVDFFARDALHPDRLPQEKVPVRPLCVVRPQSTSEVSAIVRVANVYQTPVIPMGGGSGLMGGAVSLTPGLVLDLCGLKDMRVRPADRMADVGAGVTIRALNQAVAPHGLMCGHDPWTVAVATVGGTIGTNGLGYLGGKYGAMGDQVLGVEAVLPTGDVLRTRGVEKSSTGPMLHHLFIGAEGCFGIITQATLRLIPLPEERVLEGWEFQDFATGFDAVNALFAAGLRPGLLDYGDQDPTLDYEPPAALFVSYEGPRRVAQAEAQEAAAICEQHQGRRLPEHEVRDFWELRHALGDVYAEARMAGEPWHRPHPTMDYLHVALPPSAVLSYRRQCLELLTQRGLQTHQTGLWDHAGLFSVIYWGGDMALLDDVHRALLMLCQDFQGSMEYCHGVGVRLAPLMAREHGEGLQLLRRLKHCLDPQGILNPGKLALLAPPSQPFPIKEERKG
jgi:FAD/FMN-containing dehydrogenase